MSEISDILAASGDGTDVNEAFGQKISPRAVEARLHIIQTTDPRKRENFIDRLFLCLSMTYHGLWHNRPNGQTQPKRPLGKGGGVNG